MSRTPRMVICPECRQSTQEPSEDTAWRCGALVGPRPQRMCMFDFFEDMRDRGFTDNEAYIATLLPPPAKTTQGNRLVHFGTANTKLCPHGIYNRSLCIACTPITPEEVGAIPHDHAPCEHTYGPKHIQFEGYSRSICPKCQEPINWVDAVPLTFAALRQANVARLPEFRNAKGEICHPEGRDDLRLSFWACALAGEVGEAANIIKKVERGDLTLDEARDDIARELADVQCYLDLLALRAGVDLGAATRMKFNEVSVRVKSQVRL